MAKKQRKYDMEYKIQAVKLAKELGGAKAAAELGIHENTMYAWTKAAREGRLNASSDSHTPETAMNLAEELALLRRQARELEKKIRRLRMMFPAIKTEDSVRKGKICIMEEIGLSHRPKHRPKGSTKADREARKSEDLLKRDFKSSEPLKKCVTDITEIKAKDGKLYVSAIFDCFDAAVLGMAMDTNMKAVLCERTLTNAGRSYPALRGSIIHSDHGSQYASETYSSI